MTCDKGPKLAGRYSYSYVACTVTTWLLRRFSLAFLCTCASSVWSGTEPILLSVFGCHPNPIGKDHTLRPLISLSLSFSFSHCVFQHSSQPSLLPHILPFLLISTDLSSRHVDRQTSVWCSGAHSCILTGLTHVLASQAPLQSHKLQAAKNVWNFPQRLAIIPILNCDSHSVPCTFKLDFSQIAHDYSFSFLSQLQQRPGSLFLIQVF